MSNCNNDCENCKIKDFCGYSIDTLGYAKFSRVVEEHDAKVRADAIDEYHLKLLNCQTTKVKSIHDAEIWVEFKRQSTTIAEQLKENR